MIPQKIFDKMATGGFSAEQKACIAQMMFEAVEAATYKIMTKLETTLDKMNASFGQQILAAVKETEEKILYRMEQEAIELEEKKG